MKRPVAVPRQWRERGHMAFVLIEHLVGDFETFKQVYLDDGERRRMSGSKGGKVYRAADDPNNVIIVLEWDDADRAVSGPSRLSCTRPCTGRRATSPRRGSPSSSTRWIQRSSASGCSRPGAEGGGSPYEIRTRVTAMRGCGS